MIFLPPDLNEKNVHPSINNIQKKAKLLSMEKYKRTLVWLMAILPRAGPPVVQKPSELAQTA